MSQRTFYSICLLYCIVFLISFGESKTSFQKKSTSFSFISKDNSVITDAEKYSLPSIELKSTTNCSLSCIHGTCEKDTCVCDLFYQGKTCNERFRDNKAWYGLFITYSILVILGNTMNLVIACREFHYVMRKIGHFRFWQWDSVPHLLICIILGTTFRIVLFAVDPHSERNIVDRVTTQVFLSVSVIVWLAASFLLIHVWYKERFPAHFNALRIKVQIASRILGVDRIKFLIPVMPVIAVVCAVVALPLTVAAEKAEIFQTIYNVWMALIFVSLVVIMTVVSFRLRRLLKEAQGFTQTHLSSAKGQKQSVYSTLLQKLTWYIMAMDFVLVLTIISLIVYILIDAPTNRWKYLIIHIIYRTQEVILILFTLLFIKRRTESSVSSATATNHSGNEASTRQSHMSISDTGRVESAGSATELLPQKVTFADDEVELDLKNEE